MTIRNLILSMILLAGSVIVFSSTAQACSGNSGHTCTAACQHTADMSSGEMSDMHNTNNAATAGDHHGNVKAYPLKTCLVTGEKLGSMGNAITYDYNGQEFKFCCNQCVDIFKANPEKYLKALEDAEKDTNN